MIDLYQDTVRRRMVVAAKCARVPIEGRVDAVRNRRTILCMIGAIVCTSEVGGFGRRLVSNKDLAAASGLAERTVANALRALRKQGLVELDQVRPDYDRCQVHRYVVLADSLLPDTNDAYRISDRSLLPEEGAWDTV